MTTLKYYYVKDNSISEVVFDKYTIDTMGKITNKKSGKILDANINGIYNEYVVYNDDLNRYKIRIARAIASTFIGPPPTPAHTADHIDQDTKNDTLENIRWLCKSGQNNNQCRQNTLKSAFIIVKDGVEKTAKDWAGHLKNQKNHINHTYTAGMITIYAQQNQQGFTYKKYQNLPGEVWKPIKDSGNNSGRWEISDMNRVKYITRHAENVLSGDRLGLTDTGYPVINFNNKIWKCHILAFMTFFPEEYAEMKQEEVILHEDDDKLDFRPHKLRIGTQKMNMIDAYDNGKRDDTKSARIKCTSYINGVFEKEHNSLNGAMRHLKSIGFDKASYTNIGNALKEFRNGKVITSYGRSWRPV